jgi:hypothetical protein
MILTTRKGYLEGYLTRLPIHVSEWSRRADLNRRPADYETPSDPLIPSHTVTKPLVSLEDLVHSVHAVS